MEKEKSPSDKLKEIDTVSKVVDLFIDESGNHEVARRLLEPFMEWLFDKGLEAASEMEESSGL